MEHRTNKLNKLRVPACDTQPADKLALDGLLHPASAFMHPSDVVRDPDLTVNEKRSILASWASDACALEAAPELRMAASGAVVRWDDIMDALRTLDRAADACGRPLPHYKRVLEKKGADRREIRFRSGYAGDQGQAWHQGGTLCEGGAA